MDHRAQMLRRIPKDHGHMMDEAWQVEGLVFHDIADHIDGLQLEIIRLKAALYYLEHKSD